MPAPSGAVPDPAPDAGGAVPTPEENGAEKEVVGGGTLNMAEDLKTSVNEAPRRPPTSSSTPSALDSSRHFHNRLVESVCSENLARSSSQSISCAFTLVISG